MIKIQKTKIDWCDLVWNVITGCLNTCSYCYARKINHRFKRSFKPIYHQHKLDEPYKVKKPQKIFVNSMGEVFAKWVCFNTINDVLNVIKKNPHHIFIIFTKYPEELLRWVNLPKNLWVGVSVDRQDRVKGIQDLVNSDVKVKIVCFEPLLERVDVNLSGIDWVIIGGQTNPNKPPKREWVDEIVKEAEEHNIAIWIKDNTNYPRTFKEYPK